MFHNRFILWQFFSNKNFATVFVAIFILKKILQQFLLQISF